jgi:hypothetical protein
VAQIGRLFIPVTMILDLIILPTACEQSMRDAISAHHRALAEWFQRAASWVRNGEGAAEVADGPPEPPILFGSDDWLMALATWHRVLGQDIRNILNETGPLPEPVIAVPVRDALNAAG